MNLKVLLDIMRGKAMVTKGGVVQREFHGLNLYLVTVAKKTHWEETWRLSRVETGPLDEELNSFAATVCPLGGLGEPVWRDDGSVEFRYDRPKSKAPAQSSYTPIYTPPTEKPKSVTPARVETVRDRDFYPSGGLLDRKLAKLAASMNITPDVMLEGGFDDDKFHLREDEYDH